MLTQRMSFTVQCTVRLSKRVDSILIYPKQVSLEGPNLMYLGLFMK